MNHVIEITLALFWLGYLGLHGWLLRAPAGDAVNAGGHHRRHDPLQGESSCTTQATR